jgi:hypothetical protein
MGRLVYFRGDASYVGWQDLSSPSRSAPEPLQSLSFQFRILGASSCALTDERQQQRVKPNRQTPPQFLFQGVVQT